MADWLAWSGWVGTFVFGVVSVIQFIQQIIDRRVDDANKRHLIAIKQSLQALRSMCNEAVNLGEVIRTDPVRQWVRQVAFSLLGIEAHVDAILGGKAAEPPINPPSDGPPSQAD